MDVAWLHKKWSVKQSPPKEQSWYDDIDDETTDTLSGYLCKSSTNTFDEEEEFIISNNTVEEIYGDITEDFNEEQGVAIDASEDTYNPDDVPWVPEDVLDKDYVAFAPTSQEFKFIKEREQE